MLLVGTGGSFIRALEKEGALAFYVTPEGGSEGHYRRRLRAVGYSVAYLSAKGMGDISSYLTRTHGVRPATLGKSVRRTYYHPPMMEQFLASLPDTARGQGKGLVIWLYDAHVLTKQDYRYLLTLSQQDPRIKCVVEVARDRQVSWTSLQTVAV